jgi:hypothetical protein
LRGLKLTATLVMILLAACAPALAHSPNAAAQQYSEVSPSAVEVGDVVRAAADAAARGTGALNGALSEDKSSAAAAAATLSDAAPPDSGGKVTGLTELPATGGVSPLWPCVGTLLVMAGLGSLVRRTVYRTAPPNTLVEGEVCSAPSRESPNLGRGNSFPPR